MRHFSGQIQTVGPNIRDVINIVSLMKIIHILFFSNVFFIKRARQAITSHTLKVVSK